MAWTAPFTEAWAIVPMEIQRPFLTDICRFSGSAMATNDDEKSGHDELSFSNITNTGERLSIVIPLNNEVEQVPALLSGIGASMSAQAIPWELIVVDDGSSDGTLKVLKSYQSSMPNLTVISLPTRAGQAAAVWRGLMASRGTIIITLDGDGQHEPSDILLLVDRILEGFDFVIGQRLHRCDAWHKRVFSCVGNWLRRLLTRSSIPETGCSLRAFRRVVIADLIPFKALHRFLPTMIELSDYRICVIPVKHRPRTAGRSHYGIADRLGVSILDGLAIWWLKGIRKLPDGDGAEVFSSRESVSSTASAERREPYTGRSNG
jgi:dolichol-phosphate mannosyltransferase